MYLTHWWCELLSRFKEICLAVTLVTALWAGLSMLLTLLCTFAFLQPFWFLHPDNVHTFGLWNRCIRRTDTVMESYSESHDNLTVRIENMEFYSGDDVTVCHAYGGEYFSFSSAWQAACVLCGGCCVFLFISTVIAFWCLFTSDERTRTLQCTGMYLQIIAESALVAGLLVYPLGLGSPYFQYYCGESKPFHPGYCRIGGAYMLSILCAFLGPFCPILAQCAGIRLDLRWAGKVWHPLV